jgi:GNAT superfamily N-acetyltransferase
MHLPLEIRAVKIAEHYDVISKMMHELHLNEYSLFEKTASWQDIETHYMQHVITMQDEQDGLCLVAYLGDEPVGFIFGWVEDQDNSRTEVYTGRELYVSDGFVEAKHRRQGIYHALNEKLEQHYVALGIRRITRFTLVRNTGMRMFLDNEGYFVTRLLYEKWL